MGGATAGGVELGRAMTISKRTQTFYFDEAGYTGNNLLDPSQPVFVYAGVAIDRDFASQLHAEALACYGIEIQELKGANLVKSPKGCKAISLILENISGYSHVVVANKVYALAGKFSEYIFKPVLASHSSLFYAIDFHKYIATLLYIGFEARNPHVIETLKSFAEMMRSTDVRQFEAVLSSLSHFDQSDPMGAILAFSLCHRKRIETGINEMNEMRSVKKFDAVANWTLDLSMTALYWLLASWGEKFEVLEVYCDESKPIRDAKDFFEAFIGREDKVYNLLDNQSSPSIVYNLSGPINLVDSKESHGVQIADVVSSSLAYALKNPNKDIAKEWLQLTEGMTITPLEPDLNNQERNFVNAMVLRELVNQSVRGEDLFKNMNELITRAKSLSPEYAREHNTLNAF